MKNFIKFSLVVIILFSACKKPENYFEGGAKLSFSIDTLVFDTVFTTVGSITKRIKVYNTLTEDLIIDHINLAGQENSPYRLNIDGLQSNSASDVILRAKDSLHIFVEATIDPNNSNDPFIHTDSIVFSTNGSIQDVDLVAWGQDAHFYKPSAENYILFGDNDTLFYYSINENTTWSNDKPHVIYGTVIIEGNTTLTINAGTSVYLHKNSNIIVGKIDSLYANTSSIDIQGTLGEPVLITSDRLDDYYSDLPGQWGRIWLTANSADNSIKNAIIKNGTIGLQLDTVRSNFNPALRLENSIIANHSSYGIFAYSSRIEAVNCQLSDNGAHDMYLFAGGDYRFSHCTFANYNPGHQSPSLRMSNFYEDINGNEQLRPMEKADFENCIIYGRIESEIGLEISENTTFNYKFNNCLLKIKESNFDLSNSTHFTNNIYNEDPLFVKTINSWEYDYRLDTLSAAQNIAATNVANQYPYDIQGTYRFSDEGPDMGAYERVE